MHAYTQTDSVIDTDTVIWVAARTEVKAKDPKESEKERKKARRNQINIQLAEITEHSPPTTPPALCVSYLARHWNPNQIEIYERSDVCLGQRAVRSSCFCCCCCSCLLQFFMLFSMIIAARPLPRLSVSHLHCTV